MSVREGCITSRFQFFKTEVRMYVFPFAPVTDRVLLLSWSRFPGSDEVQLLRRELAELGGPLHPRQADGGDYHLALANRGRGDL